VAYLREEYDDILAEELKNPDGNVVGAQNMSGGSTGTVSDSDFSSEDDKYEQAKEVVLQTGKTSVSNLQVRLGTGYARSAKLINMLEQAGVIITVTDNSGKKVKAVAGDSRLGNHVEREQDKDKQGTTSNTREDILKVEDSQSDEDEANNEVENDDDPDTEEKEPKSNSFFRF
jgi:chromosome condensin MukBEF MukE localization factor